MSIVRSHQFHAAYSVLPGSSLAQDLARIPQQDGALPPMPAGLRAAPDDDVHARQFEQLARFGSWGELRDRLRAQARAL